MATRRDIAAGRALAQQVAQARVTATSNTAAVVAIVETAVPANLSTTLAEFNTRISDLENIP